MASWLEPFLLIGVLLFGTAFALVIARDKPASSTGSEPREPANHRKTRRSAMPESTSAGAGSRSADGRDAGATRSDPSSRASRIDDETVAEAVRKQDWQAAKPSGQKSIRHVSPGPTRRPRDAAGPDRQSESAGAAPDVAPATHVERDFGGSDEESGSNEGSLTDVSTALAMDMETLRIVRVYVHRFGDEAAAWPGLISPASRDDAALRNAVVPAGHATGLVLEETSVTISRHQFEMITREAERVEQLPDHLRDEAVDAVADYIAEKIAEPAWGAVTRCWVTTDPGYLDRVVQGIDTVEPQLRELFLGRPVETAGEWVCLPGSASEIVGDIAAKAALPIDRPLREIKTTLEISGMVLGAATGLHPLTTVCFKAFVHDQFMHVMTEGIQAIAEEVVGVAESPVHSAHPEIAEPVESVTETLELVDEIESAEREPIEPVEPPEIPPPVLDDEDEIGGPGWI
jgi:hypothetical protein